jgi:hypothetical protein
MIAVVLVSRSATIADSAFITTYAIGFCGELPRAASQETKE